MEAARLRPESNDVVSLVTCRAAWKNRLRTEWRHLVTVNASDRLWQMPVAAALANGTPLLIGAHFGHLDYGLAASLGGLVFLYLPDTPMYHRMVSIMACAFAMIACYALGLMSQFVPLLVLPALLVIAMLVTMVCRFYAVGPPGGLFFVMAASIGAYTPVPVLQVPLMVGLVAMGALQACLIAFVYSLVALRVRAPKPVAPLPPAGFDFVVFDAVVIGVFVGIALALAHALQVQKPYWVPVSCLAVIQGPSLRAVWNKQLQRVLGTAVGLVVAFGVLLLPLSDRGVGFTIMLLSFVIEIAIVRHYAFAVVFITPLSILLAEAATLGHASPAALVQARLLDTVLGSFVGLVGGICLHDARFRRVAGGWLRRLVPARFSR
jgi:hypothetical protein